MDKPRFVVPHIFDVVKLIRLDGFVPLDDEEAKEIKEMKERGEAPPKPMFFDVGTHCHIMALHGVEHGIQFELLPEHDLANAMCPVKYEVSYEEMCSPSLLPFEIVPR